MNVYESVADAIGDTPLFRLGRLGADIVTPIYAKAEFLNIGGSVKDRAARSMIARAEADGSLRPGGTIVEATSGNTGIGLTIVGRQRGYRVVVGVSDRSAQEKVDILQAYGAEVVIAPTAVPRQDPAHLFNVVRRLVAETPGAWLADQYDNPANPEAHRRTTGPEIWAQTAGRVTHFVAGVGTGGTITGAGGYLREISGGSVTVVGADPEASAYAGGDGSPYYVESIGHFVHPDTDDDLWPQSFDPTVVDRFERIGDRESLLTARRLARDEGLLAGPSSGTAVAAALRVARELGPEDLVVVLLPDSGRSYLSKTYSDDWLRGWGFLEEHDRSADPSPLVREVLDRAGDWSAPLVTVSSRATVAEALARVDAAATSTAHRTAVPIVQARPDRPFGVGASEVLGSLDVTRLAEAVRTGRVAAAGPVLEHRGAPLPTVGIGETVRAARAVLGDDHDAALVLLDGRAVALLDRADLELHR